MLSRGRRIYSLVIYKTNGQFLFIYSYSCMHTLFIQRIKPSSLCSSTSSSCSCCVENSTSQMISELLRPQYEWALRGGLVRVPPTKKAYSPTHTHRLPNNNTKTHSRRHKHTCLYVLKLPVDKMYLKLHF